MAEGEELMPDRVDKPMSSSKPQTEKTYRKEETDTISSQAAPVQEIPMIIPLKMYSRKRGVVGSRHYATGNGNVMMQNCKRKLEISQ